MARALPSRDARSDLLLLQQLADLGQQPLFNARLRRCGRCFSLRWFLEIVDGAYHQEDRQGNEHEVKDGLHKAAVRQQHRRRLAFSRLQRRSEEHTSELQSLMRNSYAVFCLKQKSLNNILLSQPRNTHI